MQYKVLNANHTENYRKSYYKAIENNCEKECFIGNKSEYRMNTKESIILTLTDPAVLLEYCIYPLYLEGDIEIGNRIREIMYELINSCEIIGIYQVIKFIYIQDKFEKRYDQLPLVIDIKDIAIEVLSKVEILSREMKEYKEGEFAAFPKNMYEMIQGMIKKSKSFK